MTVVAPFPYRLTPMANITGMTYQDGATYLSELETLRQYINGVLIKDVNDVFADVAAQYQAGVSNAEATVTEAKTDWDTRYTNLMNALQAQIAVLNAGAISDVVGDTASAAHATITAMIDAEITAVTTALHNYTDGKVGDLSADVDTRIAAVTDQVDGIAAGIAATDYGYLVTAFTGQGAPNEKLSVFYSPDGKTIYGSGAKQVYTDPGAGASLRDPSTLKIGDTWYTAYTINNGLSKNFGVISSKDLLNWEVAATVDVSGIPYIARAWAPELVQDTNGDVYAFYSRMDVNSVGKTYYSKALNSALTSWTVPAELGWTSAPASLIDPTFVRHNNQWFCFYKREDNRYIERATSPTLTGPYTVDRTGNWMGWVSTGVEGPEIVKTVDGKWRLYVDQYDPYDGYRWSESTDLNTWTQPTKIVIAPGTLDAGQLLRHGSFVKLTDAGSVNQALTAITTKRVFHAELSALKATPADVQTGPGMISTNTDPGLNANVSAFLTIPAEHQVRLEVAGYYSVNWVAEHDPVTAGAGAFMAIKSPGEAAVYASMDIPAVSTASSVSFPPKFFPAGSVLQFYCRWGNAFDPLRSAITIHKD